MKMGMDYCLLCDMAKLRMTFCMRNRKMTVWNRLDIQIILEIDDRNFAEVFLGQSKIRMESP